MKLPTPLEAFGFCPRCGQAGHPQTNHLVCPACGLQLYDVPKCCVSVFLRNEQGEYLLVTRGIEPHKGSWDIPGGFLEVNESLEEACHREIREELGLEIGELHYLSSVEDSYDYQGITYSVVAINFTAQLPRQATIRPQDDVADYRLFKPQDFPIEQVGFESLRRVLTDIQATAK